MAKLGAIDFTSQVYSKTAVDNLLRMKQDVLVFDDTPTDGSTNPVTSWGIKLYVDASISGLGKILNWCGSVPTYADLPTENVRPGDVYNVEEDGMNVAATLDGSNDIVWDPLGPSMDVYLTKEEAASTYLSKDDASSTYALKTTVEGISSALGGHLSDTSNPHLVTKAQVGLGNADNTSDMDKPVSTAVQSALNLKANSADLAAVATSGSYNDLLDRPTIPVVNDATLTIRQQGVDKATFTANSSTDAIVDIVEVDPVFTAWRDGNAIAAGEAASATGLSSVAIGGRFNNGTTAGDMGVAIGGDSDARVSSVAVGINSKASAWWTIAIGNTATASEQGAIAVGGGTGSEHASNASGKSAVAVGLASSSTAEDALAVGHKAQATARRATAVGNEASALSEYSLAVGRNAYCRGVECASIGISSNVQYSRDAQAVGTLAYVTGSNKASAIGYNARVETAANAMQLGEGTNTVAGSLQFLSYQLLDASGNIPAGRLGTLVSGLSSVSSQVAAVKGGTAGGNDVVDVLAALLVALGA